MINHFCILIFFPIYDNLFDGIDYYFPDMTLMSPSNIIIAFRRIPEIHFYGQKMYFMVLFESLIILDNNLQSYIIDSLN